MCTECTARMVVRCVVPCRMHGSLPSEVCRESALHSKTSQVGFQRERTARALVRWAMSCCMRPFLTASSRARSRSSVSS